VLFSGNTRSGELVSARIVGLDGDVLVGELLAS
jgi:hypothetical protein